jgi:serine/threonine protein kinase
VDALSVLHSAGFVHRDARVENFMRDKEGHMVLLDLGAAVKVGSLHDSGRPWGFTYGPLHVLEAMTRHVEMPTAAPADDFEQLARVAIVAATGASPKWTSDSPAELLTQWQALDEAIITRVTGSAARDLLVLVTTGTVDADQLKAAICKLLP